MKARANAKKAGFGSLYFAEVALSFNQVYPDNITKHFKVEKDNGRGGHVFHVAFSSAELCKGDLEHSPRDEILSKLEQNMLQYQTVINIEFPPIRQSM